MQISYFYRLADFKGVDALDAKNDGTQNDKTLCSALVTLGMVDSMTAAKQLISERKSGKSKASRLLNRFVSGPIAGMWCVLLLVWQCI